MRKLLWSLVVLGVVTAGLWLFTGRSTAQPPQYIDVEGRLTAWDGSGVPSHVIQARPNSTYTWSDVATTDGDGYYYWSGNGWSNGRIWMKAKNECGLQGDQARDADSCSWVRNITGTYRATCNLTAKTCFDQRR
jgi:hypothetical protein